MKNQPKQPLARSLEQMNLPSEVLGTCHIELQSDRQILLCGQRGIRTYQEHEITVEMEHFAVQIIGNSLRFVTMNSREVLIRGVIDCVTFLR